MFLIVVISWGLIGYRYYLTTAAPMRTLNHTYVSSLVKGLAHHTQDWFEARVCELSILARSSQVRDMNWIDYSALFTEILSSPDTVYEDLTIVDLNGRATTVGGQSIPIDDREYFIRVLHSGIPTIGDVVVSRISGKPVVPVIYPINITEDKLLGFLLATISFDHVLDLLNLPDIDFCHAFFLQGGENIVASSENQELLYPYKQSFISAAVASSGLGDVSMLDVQIHDELTTTFFSPIPLVNWTLAIGIEKSHLDSGHAAMGRIVFGMLVLLTLCASAAVFLGTRIAGQQVILAEAEASQRRLALSFKSMHDALIVTDRDGNVSMMNVSAEQLTGWADQEACGMHVQKVICNTKGHCCGLFANYIQETISKEAVQSFSHVVHNALGQVLNISCTMSPLIDHRSTVTGCVIRITDETEHEKTRQRLSFYKLVAENARDALLIMDQSGRILEANWASIVLYGYSLEELLSMTIFDLRDSNTHDGITPQMQQAEHAGILFETYHRKKDGRVFPVEVNSQGAVIEGTQVLVSIIRDITDRKGAESRVNHLIYHDILTETYNRAFFEKELKRLDNGPYMPLSIIMGDVNGLKLVNDTFGHSAGDDLLRQIAIILKRSCRSTDIIARWGGDEFAIILPNTKLQVAEAVCDRISSACREDSNSPIQLSIALGAATRYDTNIKSEEVLSQAEDRMYRNKLSKQQSLRSSIIASLQQTLAEKSHETEEHAERLQELALGLGQVMGVSNNELDELLLLAKLHDIGKIAIPDDILLKAGPLTPGEWVVMRRHSEIGYRIAQATPELAPIAQTILAHHERWDGKGYPLGLSGEEIPLLARVISIVDAYDVMTHDRPYRKAIPREAALQEIERSAGTQFDPIIAEKFVMMSSFCNEVAAMSDG